MTQSNLMVAFPLYGLLLGFYKVSLLKSGTPVLLSHRDKKMASLSNPAKKAVIIEHNYRYSVWIPYEQTLSLYILVR